MKTVKITVPILLLFFMGATTFISCSKKKDNNPSYKEYKSLIVGVWDFDIETRFQENGQTEWINAKGAIENHAIEFQKDGLAKIEFSAGFPYSISGDKLNFKGLSYTITKLDQDNLVFEGVEGKAGEEEEYKGKKGTFYCVYKGLKGN